MRRLALRFLLALGVGLVVLELGLRLMLFGGGPLERLGAPLRRAELFADPDTDELWSTLNVAFDGRPYLARVPQAFDAVLGWTGDLFDPATLRHRYDELVGARRPVLLFGDSFAACFHNKGTCWDVLLERGPFARDYALLNYGVSGYGLDQIVLLFERTIELYAARDPLVLIGVFVDDDLDRVGKRITSLPKPWFEVEGGELVYHAPLASSPLAFVEVAPPRARSYAYRWLLRSGVLPSAWSAHLSGARERVAGNAEVSRLLLGRLQAGLAARGLDAVVVLFHGRSSIGVERFGWQEPLLVEELARLDLPHVATRTEIRADMQRTGRGVTDYFTVEGKLGYHYSPEAQEIAFGAIVRALQGSYDSPVDAAVAER